MVLAHQPFTLCLVLLLLCRYTAAPHPLLSFDPHFSHDGTSSGESSSGGLTSQESTMERQKPGKVSPGQLCPWPHPAQPLSHSVTGDTPPPVSDG